VLAYQQLPVADLPSVDFPTIRVTAALPGASPETMASSVALPLERQFTSIAGLTSINSSSTQGGTDITLQFDLNRNIDAAAQDVQAMIGRASRQLPPEMPSPPSYQKVNPADQSIFFIVLRSATLPLSALDEIAQSNLAQRISTVSGVAQVNVFGSQKYAVRVDVDPRELAARSLGIDEVASAIASANANLPTGTIYGERTFVVQSNGQLMRAAAFGPAIIAYRNGYPVRLDEVAHVYDGVENDRTASWQNGERCIYMAVQKQPGTNVVQVVDSIKALLPAIREQLPASVSLDVRSDRSITIKESVHDEAQNAVTVCLVVLASSSSSQPFGDHHPPGAAGSWSARSYLLAQPGQPLVDGPHLGGFRGGRRHRDAREHRPLHGDGGACRRPRRVEGSRVHDYLDDHVARGRLHPGPVYGRHRRASAARVRRDHHRRDPGIWLCLDQPDPHAVQPVPAAAARPAPRPPLQHIRACL
jgi:hypothetical protein